MRHHRGHYDVTVMTNICNGLATSLCETHVSSDSDAYYMHPLFYIVQRLNRFIISIYIIYTVGYSPVLHNTAESILLFTHFRQLIFRWLSASVLVIEILQSYTNPSIACSWCFTLCMFPFTFLSKQSFSKGQKSLHPEVIRFK